MPMTRLCTKAYACAMLMALLAGQRSIAGQAPAGRGATGDARSDRHRPRPHIHATVALQRNIGGP